MAIVAKPSASRVGPAGGTFLGYLAACFAGALTMILLPLSRDISIPVLTMENLLAGVGGVGIFFMIAVIVSLPGFALLRGGLYLLGRTDWPSFAFAGSVNGYLALMVFNDPLKFSLSNFIEYPPDIILALYGGVAGVTAWVVERRITSSAPIVASKADIL